MRRRPAASALALVLATAGASGCRPLHHEHDAGAGQAPAPAGDQSVRIVYPSAPGSFVDLVADLRPSIVHIASTQKVTGGPASLYPEGENDYALGSGVLIDVGGHVLTNYHVVEDSPELRVILSDGVEMAAKLVGSHPPLDLALLQIDGSPRLHPAKLGSSDELQVGEWVVSLGDPMGDEVTASAGIVLATGRTSRGGLGGPTPVNYHSFLQTDARIDAGNSGGALVNTAGEVIGINTAVGDRGGALSFALPIDMVKPLLRQLEEHGVVERAYIGVFVQPVTPERARELQMEAVTGALVTDVIAGGPAARAGIRRGDVVLAYAGKPVDDKRFPTIIAAAGVGKPIPVTVWRGRGKRELSITPTPMPK